MACWAIASPRRALCNLWCTRGKYYCFTGHWCTIIQPQTGLRIYYKSLIYFIFLLHIVIHFEYDDSLSYIAGWFQCLDFWHYIFAVFVFFLFVFAVYPTSSLAIAVRVCIYLLFGVTYAVYPSSSPAMAVRVCRELLGVYNRCRSLSDLWHQTD